MWWEVVISTGGGKINQQQQAAQLAAQQQTNALFTQMQAPTAAETRFNQGADAYSKFIAGKDYSAPPTGDLLNLDLWNPSHVAKQQQRLGDLEGIGGANLGGGGDSSIALQLTRERNANQAGEDAGNAYENAVAGRQNYYEGNALAYDGSQASRLGGLLSNSTNREEYYNNAYLQTRKQSLFPTLLGSALGAGGQILGAYVGKP